ncbi:MAG: methyltransferase family protein [Candidatus Thorarchaeota archaeon]
MDRNKNIKESKETFPLLGVGPKILAALVPFSVIFGVLSSIYYQFFKITINYYCLVVLGSILIPFGIFIFIYSEKTIRSAYNESELITTNTYAYVRHPMYAIWGLVILPGILCFFNSWLLFFILPIYYIIVRIFIRKEEKFLLKKHGNAYVHYKKNVNAFFPKFKTYKPEKN